MPILILRPKSLTSTERIISASKQTKLIHTVQGKSENLAKRRALIQEMQCLAAAMKHEVGIVKEVGNELEAIGAWWKGERGRVNLRGGRKRRVQICKQM